MVWKTPSNAMGFHHGYFHDVPMVSKTPSYTPWCFHVGDFRKGTAEIIGFHYADVHDCWPLHASIMIDLSRCTVGELTLQDWRPPVAIQCRLSEKGLLWLNLVYTSQRHAASHDAT